MEKNMGGDMETGIVLVYIYIYRDGGWGIASNLASRRRGHFPGQQWESIGGVIVSDTLSLGRVECCERGGGSWGVRNLVLPNIPESSLVPSCPMVSTRSYTTFEPTPLNNMFM